ncbi:hypothetical protein AB0F43_02130 [Kribbella sp. NPDC023972]|uniref:hypothetical protein n=1 Tax=Kribbella sp. NPDC023972 TaxID=3154795 RepID=UPI0033F7547B
MIDLTDSVAKHKVTFDRPITGQELIDAVRATCAQAPGHADGYRTGNNSSFYEDKRYDDGYLHVVGRSSSLEYENLLVTPDKTSAYIDPKKTYQSAVVVRHDQPATGTRTTGRYSRDDEINSTIAFAERLEHTVRHGPSVDAERSRDPLAPAGSPRRVQAEDSAKTWGDARQGGGRSSTQGPRGY